jgi:hypothetical protein
MSGIAISRAQQMTLLGNRAAISNRGDASGSDAWGVGYHT